MRRPGDENPAAWGPAPTWTRPENTVRFDLFGRIVDIIGYIRDGRTWVQARHMFEEAGYDVSWNGLENTVVIEERREAAEETAALCELITQTLQELTHHEARGEDERGQRLIANVVLNRVNSPRHPNTIKDVIFQSGINSQGQHVFQFTPAGRDTFGTGEHSDLTIRAVQQALSGVDDSQGATFFHSISGIQQAEREGREIWHERAAREGTLIRLFDHGNHRFYREA